MPNKPPMRLKCLGNIFLGFEWNYYLHVTSFVMFSRGSIEKKFASTSFVLGLTTLEKVFFNNHIKTKKIPKTKRRNSG